MHTTRSDNSDHEVELNFYYMHYNDARKLAEFAESEESKLRSIYARHSILASVFAGEALINRLINDFSQLPNGKKYLESLSPPAKWFIAPMICGSDKLSGTTFDASQQPFQKFAELVEIRNWFAHPKDGCYVKATATEGETITIMDTGEEVPWVETVKGKGDVWPHTRIPKNPFEITGEHAKIALGVLENMVKELKKMLPDIVTDAWLNKIKLKDKSSGESKTLSIDSLFGGYTPNDDEG